MSERHGCYECNHLVIELQTGPYSDVTPGDDFCMMCLKHHWFVDGKSVTEAEFGDCMAKALECQDYDRRKVKKR